MQTSFPCLRAVYGKDTGDDGRTILRAPEGQSKGCMLTNSPFTRWAIESGSRLACAKGCITNCQQAASEIPQLPADRSKIYNLSR